MIGPLLRVQALLERDADADLGPLHARDRMIGAGLSHLRDDPVRQLDAWASALEPAGPPEGADAELRALLRLLGASGVVAGALAGMGVLGYEGAGRINVLAALALLVGLQLVAAALTVVLMLPSGWRAWIPGLRALQELLAGLSPGRLLGSAVRRRSTAAMPGLSRLLSASVTEQRRYARVRKWLLLYAAQSVAVGFNVGLVATLLAFVAFTDLAFGWATTLALEPGRVHAWVAALAAPWADWLPGGAPDAALVEASRYYRVEARAAVDGTVLARWWTFLLMCILTYGLLPRLVLLGIARWRLDRAVLWTMVHLPGVAELRYRLNSELVETRASVPEAGGAVQAAMPPASRPVPAGSTIAVLWGGLELGRGQARDAVLATTGLDAESVLSAGGAADLATDENVLAEVSSQGRPVTLLVKSWEPPLGDLLDFLVELRKRSGDGRRHMVVPLAVRPENPPPAGEVAVWRDRLARLGDPWLSVHAMAPREGKTDGPASGDDRQDPGAPCAGEAPG